MYVQEIPLEIKLVRKDCTSRLKNRQLAKASADDMVFDSYLHVSCKDLFLFFLIFVFIILIFRCV